MPTLETSKHVWVSGRSYLIKSHLYPLGPLRPLLIAVNHVTPPALATLIGLGEETGTEMHQWDDLARHSKLGC